jgi:hypothetical protein
MKFQRTLSIQQQTELALLSRGLKEQNVRRRLHMKKALFSLAKSGARKKAHARLIKFIFKYPVIHS